MSDGKKISNLDLAPDLADNDELVIVDKSIVSGDEASSSGKTSKATLAMIAEKAKGDKGDKGDRGEQGDQGDQGESGPPAPLPSELSFLNGNVGIGTDSPGARLSVATDNSAQVGSFISTDTGGVSGPAKVVHIENNTATGTGILTGLAVDISGASTATKYSAIFNGGNVGIGTTDPKSELHIESNVASHDTTLKIENRHGDTGGTAIEFQGYRDVDNDHWVAKIVADHVNSNAHGATAIGSKLGFYTYDGHPSTYDGNDGLRMTIKQNGKVGIGTGTPAAQIHSYNASNHGLALTTDSGNDVAVYLGDGGNALPTGSHGYMTWDGSADKLILGTSAGGSALTVQEDGNVGIGTTSPSAKLHVSDDDGGVEVLFESSNDFDLDVKLMAGATTPHSFFLSVLDQEDVFKIWSPVSGSNSGINLTGAGNVGIGTASPSHNLDVAGDVVVGDTLYLGGYHSAVSSDNTTKTIACAPYNWTGGNSSGSTISAIQMGSAGGTSQDDGFIGFLTGRDVNDSTSGNHAALRTVMRIMPTGNVGIGTTSPGKTLELHSDDQVVAKFTRKGLGSGQESFIAIQSGYEDAVWDESSVRIGARRYETHNRSHMVFQTIDPSTSQTFADRMVIGEDGNVGIGTSNPSGNLELLSANTDTNLLMGGTPTAGLASREAWRIQAEGDKLHIGQNKSSYAKYMTFLGNNVGIGTSSPLSTTHANDTQTNPTFHVNGNVRVSRQGSGSIANQGYVYFGTTVGAPNHRYIGSTSDGNLVMRNANSAGGEAGTGKTLHYGTFEIQNGSVQTLDFDADDLDNIRPTEASGLDSINNLVVSDFEKDGVTKTGIVAQDMQKVLPQSVSGGELERVEVKPASGRVVISHDKNLGRVVIPHDDREDEVLIESVYKHDFDNHEFHEDAIFEQTNADLEDEVLNESVSAQDFQNYEFPADASFEQTQDATYEEVPSKLAVSDSELISVLVKAVQELSAEVNELRQATDRRGITRRRN